MGSKNYKNLVRQNDLYYISLSFKNLRWKTAIPCQYLSIQITIKQYETKGPRGRGT